MVVKLLQENENFGFYRKFKIKNVINSYAFYTKRCVFTPKVEFTVMFDWCIFMKLSRVDHFEELNSKIHFTLPQNLFRS